MAHGEEWKIAARQGSWKREIVLVAVQGDFAEARKRERARDDEEILRRLGYSTKLRREKLVAMLGYFVLGVSFAGGFCGSGFRRWVFGSGFWRWLFKSGFYLLFGMLLLFTIF